MVKLYEVKISALRTKTQRTLREQFKLLDVVSPNTEYTFIQQTRVVRMLDRRETALNQLFQAKLVGVLSKIFI